MKLAANQPYFFPYLGYFQLIRAADEFILYDQVDYIRHGWVNRNRLLPVNGRPAYFIAPIQSRAGGGRIRDIRIDNSGGWFKRTLKQIEVNYRRAPHFREIFPRLEEFFTGREGSLAALNGAAVRAVCACLEMKTKIVADTAPFDALEVELGRPESDLRQSYRERLQVTDPKTIRILEICRRERADTYINPIGGRALYDRGVFERNGIRLFFIQTRPVRYPQRTSGFFPDLSIVDVLMNCGKDGTRDLLDQYDLI